MTNSRQRTSRRHFIRTLATTAAATPLVGLAAAQSAETAPRKRPNLLFVFPDELRKEALGYWQADPVQTPQVDRFAAESLNLTHCVSNHPVCSPYRGMLMTGQYPHKNGVHWNCTSERTKYGNYLKETAQTFSDALHDAGYYCGYIGKWHLDGPKPPFVDPVRPGNAMWNSYTPPGPARHHFQFWHAYGCANNHMRPHYWIGDAPVDQRTYFDQWSPEHEADTAIEFIENKGGAHRAADKPWALFVAMNPPHMPFDLVPERYKAIYKDATPRELLNRKNVPWDATDKNEAKMVEKARKSVADYFACVSGVDEQFGRILACLRQQGLDEDTVVVFTSDHGEMMGSQGRMYKNIHYTEAFGIPFLVRWTGKIKPGKDDLLLGTPDNMPTLLALMGLSDRIPPGVEGVDHSPALLGRKHTRPESAWYVVSSPTQPAAGTRGIRTHRHTLLVHRGRDGAGERVELYDDLEDPWQLRDIAGESPKVLADLAPELNRWLKHNDDPWRPFSPKT